MSADRLGARHRAGDPRPAQDPHEDVLRLRAVLRRGAQHAHLPGLPRPARLAAGDQRPGDPLRADDGRWRSAARSPRARSSRARTTSIPTCPRTTRSPSTTCRSARGGRLGDVRLHRIHLEEDAAKLVHVGESGRIHGSEASVVDFNRGGTPLAEIVTEPDLHSAEQARDWLTLLRVTLRQLGVSDVNMEEGSLRATPTSPCAARASRRARDQDRAQEHELLPLPDAGHQRGDRAPDRAAARRGEPRRPGDAALRPAPRAAELAALQGGGARLPLLPRARPRPGGAHARRCSRRRATRCPSCPPSAPSATSATGS